MTEENLRKIYIHEFIEIGIEHYILGRYAFFAGFFSTVGINTHRAFELILKASIKKKNYDEDVTIFKHQLVDIYKKHCELRNIDPSTRLNFIEGIQAFEKIRYPLDSKNGKAVRILFFVNNEPEPRRYSEKYGNNNTTLEITYNLNDTDAVFREILEQSSVDLNFVKLAAKGDSKIALYRDNNSFKE